MRWMVVGHGGIVGAFVTAIDGLDGNEVAVVTGRSEERAGAFAGRRGIPVSTTDIGSQLENVDAVYVGTPHPFHADAASRALEAGVPVLCEKPMTLTLAQTSEVVELARTNDVFLMEAVWTRFLPIYDQVFGWIDNGAIGTPRGIKASFGFRKPFDPAHRLFDPALGGGALYDIGIYPLHVAEWLFGPPVSVVGAAAVGASGVDEYTSVLGTYRDGIHGDLSATTRIALDSRAIVWGDDGWIEIPKFWMAQEATLHAAGREEHRSAPFEVNGYEYEIREVARCLEGGFIESPGMPWSASLSVASQVDEVLNQVGRSA